MAEQRTSDTTQRPDPSSGRNTAAPYTLGGTNSTERKGVARASKEDLARIGIDVSKISKEAEAHGREVIKKKSVALQELDIVYVPVNHIKPNLYNPNRQSSKDFELLVMSMAEDGFTQPIIVNTGKSDPKLKDRIVDGEHRWRAAQALGYEEIPVVYVDMTPEQMKISTLRHNRARGNEDQELTVELLRDLQKLGALEWAADSLMIDDQDLNAMLDNLPAPEALAGDEFSQAWLPSPVKKMGSMLNVDEEGKAAGGIMRSMTRGAEAQIQAASEKASQANTLEGHEAAMQGVRIYRVSVVFTEEEATLAQGVLGPAGEQAQNFMLIAMYLKEKGLVPDALGLVKEGK